MEKPSASSLPTDPFELSELARLEALRGLQILDTASEIDFDDIIRIAATICDAPIALLSLVDKDRQWFKSKVGLNATETSREIAFCSHAIKSNEIFVVEDASLDPRFFQNPLVTQSPHIRFYAGVPVLAPKSKFAVGTICIADTKPRKITREIETTLVALSRQIQRLFELRKHVSDLTAINENLLFQRVAFDSLSEGVVLQDRSGKIIDYNPAALRVLGLSADQLGGRSSLDPNWNCIRRDGSAYPGSEHPAMVTLASGRHIEGSIMGVQMSGHEPRWISINSSPIFLDKDKMPSHAITSFVDISDQLRTQDLLIKSAKFTSLGEMAGGIAHEINTPLAVISSATRQAKKILDTDGSVLPKALEKLNLVQQTTDRIAQIVRGLKMFSRRGELDPPVEVQLSQLILDTVSLCSEKIKNRGTKLVLNLDENIRSTVVPTLLSQVVLNLIQNAADAALDTDPRWIEIDLYLDSKRPLIKVRDSGKGIPNEVLERIMEPFFSTKPPGEGTGLGLSISKSIVEGIGGRLDYGLDRGHTSFSVQLPEIQKT